ncbi:MAG TPA: class I SAM-dependent methyltransferase [Bryobacteraceae bacterium]|jgi:ubiquinone/menaquinone biosynthesis C-methylase UbiE
MSGWDDPETAQYYEAFCRRHDRYLRANAALIANAQLEPGMRVLDLAAGTGRTAEAALEALGSNGRIVCVEPSAAMRAEGMRRLADPRIKWHAVAPDANESFDRVLCGAAIWQLAPLAQTFQTLARMLRPGGALSFNIPALYLLEPDAPGGGGDPLLLSLPALLLTESRVLPEDPPPQSPLSRRCISVWLKAAGLRPRPWSFRSRLTQDAYADWLKIPPLTDRLLSGLSPHERAQRIDAALASVDRSSWKWERWRGWTAWKS